VQVPAWQRSAVQKSPVSHVVPSGFFGFEHSPVVGLHVPATWHWSEGVHTTGLAPWQIPPWQVSECVHRLPSLQGVPFGSLLARHCALALHRFGLSHWVSLWLPQADPAARLVHALRLTFGWHDWQGFDGLVSPVL